MGEQHAQQRVLIIEDAVQKHLELERVIRLADDGRSDIAHAATLVQAEHLIEAGPWSLIVLDMSMDISPSSHGTRSRGQANTGGLEIAEKMFLLGLEAPTIVVTAFDTFSMSSEASKWDEIIGFEEIDRLVRGYLGEYLICCLRYKSPGWEQTMLHAVEGALS